MMTSGLAALAPPALAQSAAEESSAVESAGASRALEEVIVTAQRREESLQDAAIPIETIDQDQLIRSGVESAQGLGALSPSLGIAAGGGPLTSIFIRGVGALSNGPLFDAAVAQNYDGVYLGRSSAAAGQSLYDMERIELLKGPQGTLYGRNATGGVLNYIPRKPTLDEYAGYVQAEVGNFSKIGVQGAINFPIGDTAAIRLAGNYLDRDAYADDGAQDADIAGVRGQLLWEPNDALSVRFAADFTEIGGHGAGGDLTGTFGTAPGTLQDFTPSGLGPDSGGTSDAANAVRTSVLAAPAFAFLPPIDSDTLFQDFTYSGVLAEINYSVDAGTFTFIPAFRESEVDYTFVGPAFAPASTKGDNDQTSIEARFATEFDGSFNSVFGAFYIEEETDYSTNFNQVFVAPIQNYETGGDSWAVFAQGTFDLTDTVRLNAGVRFTEDNKFVDGISNTFVTFCGGPFPPGTSPIGPGLFELITPPDSFAAGCAAPGGLPVSPLVTTLEEFIDTLVAQGYIPPGSTPDDGFYPIISGVPGAIVDVGSNSVLRNDLSYEETTYRIGFEWDVAEDSLIYAGYERGYRAGGVDISQVSPTYEPEFIDAYTVGSKNWFLDSALQLNVELFYWEYQDQQVSYFATVGGGPTFPTANGDSTIQGIDVDLLWAATDNTTIGAKVQLLDSTFDRLDLFSDPGTGRFGCPVVGTNPAGLEIFDCSGAPLLYSPEVSLDLSVTHVFDVSRNFDIIGAVDFAYRDDQSTDFSNLPVTLADSYSTVDLEASLVPLSDRWMVTAFVRNATDERYLATTSSVGNQGVLHQIFSPPRTYGVRLRVGF
ncbi:MAG: TonB-dependent receptor [Rhodospirillaceae bacterium]|nr:TonB-dependent receptor [Rhodospirillaceae bacterium]